MRGRPVCRRVKAQVRAILEAEGHHAYGHSGILDAVNTVLWRVGQPELKPDAD